MEILIDDLKINYIKKGSGKTILIIPGWGAPLETYNVLIDAISEYASVISLDMPGVGLSNEPKKSWNLDEYIEFIIKFIRAQKIKELDVIAHSNGGRIIIKMLGKFKLDFKINKVVLIGSAGIIHKKSIGKRIKIRTYKLCKKIAQTKFISKLFPDMLDKVKNYFGSADYKNASPIMRESMVKLINEDIIEYLPKINVPTLLIWGDNDTATPLEDAKTMERLIPDSGLVSVKGCSHYVFLEEPIYVNNVIKEFLGVRK